MEFGLRERIPIWVILAITALLLWGSYTLLALVESHRAKLISPWLGADWVFTCRYADYSALQPCWEDTATPPDDFSSVGTWKGREIEIKPAYVKARESLQYRLVEAKVASYWPLRPPEIKVKVEVYPKPNVELTGGKISIQFRGCAVLAPEYWLKEEQKAAETLKKVLAKDDPELVTRAQSYIEELNARKKLLSSNWMITGSHETEVSSFSSTKAVLLAVARYSLWVVIAVAGFVFCITILTYLLALKSK